MVDLIPVIVVYNGNGIIIVNSASTIIVPVP